MSSTSARSAGTTERAVATRSRAAGLRGNGKVPHFSVAERAARGKAAWAEVPRDVRGVSLPTSGRRDPVEMLEEQAASRVSDVDDAALSAAAKAGGVVAVTGF